MSAERASDREGETVPLLSGCSIRADDPGAKGFVMGKSQLPIERRFLKGAALSVWQNAPDEASQWTAFARRPHNLLERLLGKNKQLRIDISPDFWNRYLDDIACAQQLGSNSLRLSLEWSRVMPHGPGRYDEAAVQRYRDILDRCVEAGLEPMVTLHHFVHPQWFERLGGFERGENIRYFVDWALTAFQLFRAHGITLIATFNEPTCAAFTGQIVGVHAPGRRGAVAAAGRVLLNMLRAHSAAYRAIRSEPGGESVRVGLVHQKIRFESAGSGLLHGPASWTAEWLTHCFGWDVVHEYMLTGRFTWRLIGRPGRAGEMVVNEPGGRPPCDWLGINYYTRVVLDWRLGFTCRHGEVLTDMGWPVVPEGLYDAIAHSAELGLPLYITETGIADGRDDRRAALIASYWHQMSRATAAGFDVRGFYYWTLCDNYEWHLGYNMKFGLFEWTEAPEGYRIKLASSPPAEAAAMVAAAAVDVAAPCAKAAHPDPAPDRTDGLPGASAAATVTATIISVLQPTSQSVRPKPPSPNPGVAVDADDAAGVTPASADADADVTAALKPNALAAGASPPMPFHVEQAVAEAEASASRWAGRRLRPGSLELVRRYVATPDELLAARQALMHTVWPHVPLPEVMRRRPAAPKGLAAVAAAAAQSLLHISLVVAAGRASVAAAAVSWNFIGRSLGALQRREKRVVQV